MYNHLILPHVHKVFKVCSPFPVTIHFVLQVTVQHVSRPNRIRRPVVNDVLDRQH